MAMQHKLTNERQLWAAVSGRPFAHAKGTTISNVEFGLKPDWCSASSPEMAHLGP